MKNKLNLPELESKKVFAYFEELAAIPHGSRNTRQISDYLISFAKEHGLECYQDEANNVVIIQEASAGYESADPIIMQGHMDMVCEKEKGVEIDFEKDGLELYVDGDFLKAKGTTLGGDDGVAVAYILAIMDSPEIAHPRLEAVITVDEEIGMLGAEVIDLSMLKGHKMLNIDSDVEGHFLTSCAGGMTVDTVIPVTWQKQQGYRTGLTVTGLEGGHSGSEIDKEHANANILMGRVLKYLSDRMELAVVSLAGGLKDNAIPRECEAEIVIPEEKKAELAVYTEENEGNALENAKQLYDRFSSQVNKIYFKMQPTRTDSEGMARTLIGASVDSSETTGVYIIAANDGEKNYILKFTYPDPDMKDDYNAIDYVVDCVYRYCSFSGGTYRPRTYQQFLKDDMGKKK